MTQLKYVNLRSLDRQEEEYRVKGTCLLRRIERDLILQREWGMGGMDWVKYIDLNEALSP